MAISLGKVATSPTVFESVSVTVVFLLLVVLEVVAKAAAVYARESAVVASTWFKAFFKASIIAELSP